MSIEQRVIVNLVEEETKDKLGELKISAEASEGLKYKKEFENFETQRMEFENVPRVKEPDNETPIQYCTKWDLGAGARIMLLEENSYQVRFDSEYEIDETRGDELFPILEREGKDDKITLERWRLDESDERTERARLNFHSYVGKSFFDVKIDNKNASPHPFEVRSKKIGYQDQYPAMIADLSEAASSLIYEKESPLYQDFDFDEEERTTNYEDFMFLEYLFRPEELPQAYEYVLNHMYNRLEKQREVKPIGSASSIGPKELVNIVSNSENLDKCEDPPSHWPKQLGGYVPKEVQIETSTESIDTPENRLLKNLLISLDKLISKLRRSKPGKKRGYISDKLEEYHNRVQDFLSHDWIEEVGELQYVPSNSQVLQKREGYRDIFQYFLNFHFAFRMQWEEIGDKLRGYNRRLSELYEYWCYFKIVEVLEELSGQSIDYRELFETKEWAIKVKKGKKSKTRFEIGVEGKKVDVKLMYNRLFSRNTRQPSYSLPFKPDYTLFINTNGIRHFVHFDAKYRSVSDVIQYYEKLGEESIVEDQEKKVEKIVDDRDREEEDLKTYKNADIYKMHTYKDAIVSTQGSYILYPGDKETVFRVKEDEPIPSVGAFPLTPGKDGGEKEEMEKFLIGVIKTVIK